MDENSLLEKLENLTIRRFSSSFGRGGVKWQTLTIADQSGHTHQ